jgi:hypothetical protein
LGFHLSVDFEFPIEGEPCEKQVGNNTTTSLLSSFMPRLSIFMKSWGIAITALIRCGLLYPEGKDSKRRDHSDAK